ncbi:MAG TPA: hypothetical protein VM187_13625 [Niastella sp.]|nr:hypothetical protein [Niastella sp.]
MKSQVIMYAAFVCLLTSTSCSNKKEAKSRADSKNVIATANVPEVVKNAFSAKYPGASQVIWEDATEGTAPTFKVKFKRDDKFWKAEFKQDGSFVKDNEDYK